MTSLIFEKGDLGFSGSWGPRGRKEAEAGRRLLQEARGALMKAETRGQVPDDKVGGIGGGMTLAGECGLAFRTGP